MNEETAGEVVQIVGSKKARFFECNVLETESIAAAVKGSLAWVKEKLEE
jgi:3-hydroxyacyl-CoA dehydrogenase/3-hydroxy-2-methylbutyryl-CoA dehydrogenase